MGYKAAIVSFVIALLLPIRFPLQAQDYEWCGYALIQGLPLLENQLGTLAAITPTANDSVNPYQLFQYRFSLDHTEVIVEGCWNILPTRDLFIELLSRTVKVDQETIDRLIKAGWLDPKEAADPLKASAAYINSTLSFSIFAPNANHMLGAASVRYYLAEHSKAWESNDAQ